MKKLSCIAAGTILAASLAGLGPAARAKPAGRGGSFLASSPCPGCNVVLVSFDTLAASHVHALGHAAMDTPTIDSLAKKGVLFTRARSPAPWTLPATMSWFTGTYPSVHKVVNKYVITPDGKLKLSNLKELAPGTVTLTEALKAHGYATGGFTGDAGVNGAFGFKAGFDVYSDSVPPFSGMRTSIPKALSWLASLKGRRFFLFLHGYGIHGQYDPPGGYDRRFVSPPYLGYYDGLPSQQRVLRELGLRGPLFLDPEDVLFWRRTYDEKVAREDAQFAGFLSAFQALGISTRTVFILASDHGDELYEHGRFDHGPTLYDEVERVLFTVASPGITGRREIGVQVGTLDIMPTILDLVGIRPSVRLARQIKGRSLVPLLRGDKRSGEDVYMETDYRLFTHKRGVATQDGWKLIYTIEGKTIELYDLKHDPGEKNNLALKNAPKAAALKSLLLDHYRSLGLDLANLPMGCDPVYPDQCH